MASPILNLRSSLAPPLILLLGCGAAEGIRPPAPLPAGWRHCEQGQLGFDHPPTWTVTTRPLAAGAMDIILSTADGGRERCILVLHFGPEQRFPAMERMKPYARKAFDTRIGGARARRIDPPESELPGTSEGILELGGPAPFRQARFRYAGLDGATRQAAEQVLASLRNQAPRP